MVSEPLVSVICLSYNHQRFLKAAIESVLAQTYANIEIIVVDDASSDNSQLAIEKIVAEHPLIIYLPLQQNVGNCAAFNVGLKASKGDFIIDLATDDLLMPNRVSEGVKALQEAGAEYGVTFSNCEVIDEQGSFIKYHYPINEEGRSLRPVPEGDVFLQVIKTYFICPPTVMFRREVIERLGGYDERLTYEDFDLWIRSSRYYKYKYVDQVLVKKRTVTGSKGKKQFKIGSPDTRSTYLVCEKAAKLVKTKEEAIALRQRLYYELRVAMKLLNFREVYSYMKLIGGSRKWGDRSLE